MSDTAEKAQTALQQAQPPSRYPPWFVPMPVIADRRTVSTVVDFFVVNPLTETFSHCAILFAFTSAGQVTVRAWPCPTFACYCTAERLMVCCGAGSSGTVQRPLIWVSSLIASSTQANGLVRYVSLGLMLALLAAYLLHEYVEVKKLGFKVWIKGGWTFLLLFHLAMVLCFLACFAAVQIIALLVPKIRATVAANGYYDISEVPTVVGESGFFQLVSDYGKWFRANDGAVQACAIFGSLAAVTGCVLVAKLIPGLAGVGTKCLQMTFRKVKNYLLVCSVGLLAILLIFVSFGNISFGSATSSFTGYYERQADLCMKSGIASNAIRQVGS